MMRGRSRSRAGGLLPREGVFVGKLTMEAIQAKILSLSDDSISGSIREITRQDLLSDGYLCHQCAKVFATSRVYLPGQCGAKCIPVCEGCRDKIRKESERAGDKLTSTGFVIILSKTKQYIDIPLNGYIVVKQRCANCKKNIDHAHVSYEGKVFCSVQCEIALWNKCARSQ
jgi:hypothetical protein